MPVYMYVQVGTDAHEGQKAPDSLETELQVILRHLMWVRKTELRVIWRNSKFLTAESSLQLLFFFSFRLSPQHGALNSCPFCLSLLSAGNK